jgi:hypothetical protein
VLLIDQKTRLAPGRPTRVRLPARRRGGAKSLDPTLVTLILKYWQTRPSGRFTAGHLDYHHHAATQTIQPGSMPFAFSADAAAGAVSNFVNALAASGSLELEAIPAAKMVYNCNSVGNGPRSSTPRTDTSSLA